MVMGMRRHILHEKPFMFTPATAILPMNLTIENVIIKDPNYFKLYVKMESCKLITYFIQNHRLILPHLYFGNHLY